MNVRPPRAIVRSTSARIGVTPCTYPTPRATIGSPPADRASAKTRSRPGSCRMRGEIEDDDERDQHEAESQRERQIALARLERDCGRHHARHAVDIAPDDHYRADLGDRAAESGKQHGCERVTRVP